MGDAEPYDGRERNNDQSITRSHAQTVTRCRPVRTKGGKVAPDRANDATLWGAISYLHRHRITPDERSEPLPQGCLRQAQTFRFAFERSALCLPLRGELIFEVFE